MFGGGFKVSNDTGKRTGRVVGRGGRGTGLVDDGVEHPAGRGVDDGFDEVGCEVREGGVGATRDVGVEGRLLGRKSKEFWSVKFRLEIDLD